MTNILFNLLKGLLPTKQTKLNRKRRRCKRNEARDIDYMYYVLKHDLLGVGTMEEISVAFKKRTGRKLLRTSLVCYAYKLKKEKKLYANHKGLYATKKKLLKLVCDNYRKSRTKGATK